MLKRLLSCKLCSGLMSMLRGECTFPLLFISGSRKAKDVRKVGLALLGRDVSSVREYVGAYVNVWQRQRQ